MYVKLHRCIIDCKHIVHRPYIHNSTTCIQLLKHLYDYVNIPYKEKLTLSKFPYKEICFCQYVEW